jgi:hypothetical protein
VFVVHGKHSIGLGHIIGHTGAWAHLYYISLLTSSGISGRPVFLCHHSSTTDPDHHGPCRLRFFSIDIWASLGGWRHHASFGISGRYQALGMGLERTLGNWVCFGTHMDIWVLFWFAPFSLFAVMSSSCFHFIFCCSRSCTMTPHRLQWEDDPHVWVRKYGEDTGAAPHGTTYTCPTCFLYRGRFRSFFGVSTHRPPRGARLVGHIFRRARSWPSYARRGGRNPWRRLNS